MQLLKVLTLCILLCIPCLAHAYGIGFDTLTAGTPVTTITASGNPDVAVSFSTTGTGSPYVADVWTTTSPVNYLSLGINDPTLSFYLSPFLPGDSIRLDFSAPVQSLSAMFIITAYGPGICPFTISDSPAGGSPNSSFSQNLDVANGYDSWAVGFSSSTPFTTAYFLSSPDGFYSFNVDDINFQTASPVPEPSTLFLLGSAGAGLWLVRKRRS